MSSESGNGQKGNRTVLFLHIPKTAGTTLNRIIEREYPPTRVYTINGLFVSWSLRHLKGLSEARRGRFDAIRGHFAFGLHEWVPQPCTYVTMLREPIDRVISTYCYTRENRLHPLHREVTRSVMSIDEFVRHYEWRTNMQCKYLAGLDKREPVRDDSLEIARANLRTWFSVVGITHRFDDTLRLLRAKLGWKTHAYRPHRRTQTRLKMPDVPESTKRLIAETNRLDMELYAYSLDRFEQSLKELAEDEPVRFRNGAPGPISTFYRSAISQVCSVI